MPPTADAAASSPRPDAFTVDGDADRVVPQCRPNAIARSAPPQDAVTLGRDYAVGATNWSWETLAARLASLRQLTAAPLSGELENAITAACENEALRRDRPSSVGKVAAVTARERDGAARLVVVTRERETGSGAGALGPATYRVYLGEAHRRDGEWRMVAWRRAP